VIIEIGISSNLESLRRPVFVLGGCRLGDDVPRRAGGCFRQAHASLSTYHEGEAKTAFLLLGMRDGWSAL